MYNEIFYLADETFTLKCDTNFRNSYFIKCPIRGLSHPIICANDWMINTLQVNAIGFKKLAAVVSGRKNATLSFVTIHDGSVEL